MPGGTVAGDWVFISFAYVMSGPIEVVLDDSIYGGGGTIWDVAKWYNPQTPADPWKTHRIGAPNNDLVTIDHKMGVWLHLTATDGTLSTGIVGDYSAVTVLITLPAFSCFLTTSPSVLSIFHRIQAPVLLFLRHLPLWTG